MARRELEAPGVGEELHSAKARASDINRKEERCCLIYEEGLKVASTGRTAQRDFFKKWLLKCLIGGNEDLDKNLFFRTHVELLPGFLHGKEEEKDQRRRADGKGEEAETLETSFVWTEYRLSGVV